MVYADHTDLAGGCAVPVRHMGGTGLMRSRDKCSLLVDYKAVHEAQDWLGEQPEDYVDPRCL